MNAFDDATRQGLRTNLMAQGASSAEADMVADLAIHAANEADRALFTVIKGAPDSSTGNSAFIIALQLASLRFTSLQQHAVASLVKRGVQPAEATVSMNL